jgi:peptidoglycan hydrolase CwlO-like protein
MRRGTLIGACIAGVAIVFLAVSLAKTGTELDQLRMERGDLQSEVEALHRQLDQISGQRQNMLGQLDDQVRAIEQLKREMERIRLKAPQQTADAVSN